MKTIFAAVFFLLLLSVAFLIGGIDLVQSGGSVYYALTGVLMAVAALALWRKSAWALYGYGFILVSTTVWALSESGLDPWALLPRLFLLTGVGLLLLLPQIGRHLRAAPSILGISPCHAFAAALAVPVLAFTASLLFGNFAAGGSLNMIVAAYDSDFRQDGGEAAESSDSAGWTTFSGTPSGTRFSALTAISPDNVEKLAVAWTYSFGEEEPKGLQATPIKIGDALYLCNASNVIVSLDAETGAENWRFDPNVDLAYVPFPVCRGVAYHATEGEGKCARRIYTATMDARLLAVDAHTGERCETFGVDGEVSLTAGLGNVQKGYYYVSSAPLIARGKIVLGGSVLDNQYWGTPSGVVRAFDALSGELHWAYDVGRPDSRGLPPEGDSYTHSTPNAWAPMSYDDVLGLVYVPTGNPAMDFFGGGRRPIDDEISSAVMALDIETGDRRWVFQTVHHDLWDYDVASQPVMVDLSPAGSVRKALLVPTKRGEVFLLDRKTGSPIDPVEDRPVPQRGAAVEERLSPTQPFPGKMPSLSGAVLTEDMMWGLTPLDQMWCRIAFRRARYDGPMTPPGLTPSIQYPGTLGGMNWGGVSVDTGRRIMVAVTGHVANYIQLIARTEADAMGVSFFGSGSGSVALEDVKDIGAQVGAPYAVKTAPFLSPLQVPCQQPPWSRLSAINLDTLEVLWSKPLGTGRENGPLGIKSRLPLTMGVPALGGSLVTASGLTFIAASVDRTFRAFDTVTGALLWEAALPESGNAHPMTYRAQGGRQFVVIAAGGHKLLNSKDGDSLVAFALPE